MNKNKATLHGTLVHLFGIGALITGPAGTGKSAIALELVARGHKLVADDMVECCFTSHHLIGQAPSSLYGFLETRGLGILNIARLFDNHALKKEATIDLIIELTDASLKESERHANPFYLQTIEGISISSIKLPVHGAGNLAIQCEVAAKNYQLQQHGYLSHADLRKHCFQGLQ